MFHHKLLRRLLALICALALCLGLSGPVSAAGDVYFSRGQRQHDHPQ